MTAPAGFGVSGTCGYGDITGRTQSGSCQTADKVDASGAIVGQVTHGAAVEVTEEFYSDSPASFVSLAVDGQTGNEVITAHSVTETTADYAKGSITKRKIGDSTPAATA